MIEFIKRCMCKHDMKIIEDQEWVKPSGDCLDNYRETRKYMVCLKCGYKRKVSKR